jgi:dihydrolipoamide dehydrogenase
MQYDLIVIGSGPGGYVASIRAAQLGLQTAVVECDALGGVCLNRGCIPTKALLKSAQTLDAIRHAADYGIIADNVSPDIAAIVARARTVSATMSRGVEFLLKKNRVTMIRGFGRITAPNTVEVTGDTNVELTSANIIIATGARPKELPSLPVDERYVQNYRQALFPDTIPESMAIVGSGAIGVELAYFYNTIGVEVTLIEYMPNIVPLEDADVSTQLSRSLRKAGIRVMTSASVDSATVIDGKCLIEISTKKGGERLTCDRVLSAAGVVANIENIGLENIGVEIEKGKIKTDAYCRTNVEHVYAIGDVIATPALAHVASSEAIVCVETIAGRTVEPVNYNSVPSCIYTTPEVASAGLTERRASEEGVDVKIGKFPFSASGKAATAGNRDGFVKLIFDRSTDRLLGAHLVGLGVTEIIAELSFAIKSGATSRQILSTIHPHPTMSEAIAEAAAAANGETIHL